MKKLKVAVYWGCKIPTEQYAYELSLRQVLPIFNVELVDLKGTSCCGGPVRSINNSAALYLSIRNMALPELANLTDLLVPCNECHFMMSEGKNRVENDGEAREKTEELLRDEGLQYSQALKIWHVIDLLHDSIGVDAIVAKVKKPLNGLKFVVHPGCQIIRPSDLRRVDSPEQPRKLDTLVEALGAETIDYPEKLDCCGAALTYSHQDAALSLSGTKLKAIQALNVDAFIDTCPYCHGMYDTRQEAAAATVGGKLSVPTLYYTQILGLALGINREKLGLHLNQSIVQENPPF